MVINEIVEKSCIKVDLSTTKPFALDWSSAQNLEKKKKKEEKKKKNKMKKKKNKKKKEEKDRRKKKKNVGK